MATIPGSQQLSITISLFTFIGGTIQGHMPMPRQPKCRERECLPPSRLPIGGGALSQPKFMQQRIHQKWWIPSLHASSLIGKHKYFHAFVTFLMLITLHSLLYTSTLSTFQNHTLSLKAKISFLIYCTVSYETEKDPAGPSQVQKLLQVPCFLFIQKCIRLLGLPWVPKKRYKQLLIT